MDTDGRSYEELKPNDVPKDIWSTILDYLPNKDVNSFRQCNIHFRDTPLNQVERRWYSLLEDNTFDPVNIANRVLEQDQGGTDLWDILVILRRVNPQLRLETEPVNPIGQKLTKELLKLYWRDPFYTWVNVLLPKIPDEQYEEVAISALDNSRTNTDWDQFIKIVEKHQLQSSIAKHVSKKEYEVGVINFLFQNIFTIKKEEVLELAQSAYQERNPHFLVILSYNFPDIVKEAILDSNYLYEEISFRDDYENMRDYFRNWYIRLYGDYPITFRDEEIDEDEENRWNEEERNDYMNDY